MIGLLTRLRTELIKILFPLIITTSVFGSELNQKIQLPEIERKSFLNGMEVLFFKGDFEELPFALMIKNGAAFDPAGKGGATYLMARMILESLDDQYMASELAGVKINLFVDWDAIYFFGSAPQEKMEGFLIELSRVLTSSDFKQEEFERIRSMVLTEISEEQNTAPNLTKAVLLSRLFGNNPYSHPVKGSIETVTSLFFRDTKIQYRKLLLPNQTKLALYYPGDREKLFRNLSRQWGSWVRDEPAPFTFRKSSIPETSRILVMSHQGEDSLAFLRLGFLGVEASSRHAVTLQVLREYLTFSLPDWAKEVANESHLQGTVDLASRKMPGYMLISIRCTADRVGPYIERFQKEIQGLLGGKIDERRFAEAKMLVTQQYGQHLQDPVRSIEAVLKTDLYELGIHYIVTFGLRVERITPELFQRGISATFPEGKFLAVIATPTLEIQDNLALLGEVELLN